MKKLFALIITVALLLICSPVFAAPFLVCDPQSNTDEYIIIFDGTEEIVAYNEQPEGYVILKDLVGIAEGSHHIEIKARNMWGESIAVPFDFTKVLPGKPINIELKK